MDELLVEKRGAVTLITLNRPDAHNSVTGDMAAGLAEGIDAFAADDSAHVLVITGAGDRSFCSGANLKDIDALLRHPHTERAGPMGFAHLDPGKPTIAAVNGYCFAGGMELACWCDFRIASANAEFGALNRRWGVPFIDGGTQRFPRIMGQGNALWMVETGVRIDAARALSIGLVQEVVPARGTGGVPPTTAAGAAKGSRLSDEELVSFAVTLLGAGTETTTNLIGVGTLALLQTPAELARLRADPGLIGAAVEELLRFESPVQMAFVRVATEDTSIGGEEIVENELVCGLIGAANHDPAVFPDPGELRIDRPAGERAHMAFGQGVHYCMGAALARAEGEIALQSLLVDHFPGLTLAGPAPAWRSAFTLRGVESLWVTTGT
jgi:cytochrome P450